MNKRVSFQNAEAAVMPCMKRMDSSVMEKVDEIKNNMKVPTCTQVEAKL